MVRRLAVLGGSFDPPHLGHLHMVQAVARALQPVQVRLLPAACPPHKVGQSRASTTDRRHLCECLAAEMPGVLEVDTRELDRGGVSYTYDTLQEILAEEPTELFFLIGADSLRELGSWWRVRELLALVTFVTLPRPGVDLADSWPVLEAQLGAEAVAQLARNLLEVEARPESSSGIRHAIRDGRPWQQQVPEAVADYIQTRGLYRS